VESLALDSPSKDDFYYLEKQQDQINDLLNRISAMEENILLMVECIAKVSNGSKFSFQGDALDEVSPDTESINEVFGSGSATNGD